MKLAPPPQYKLLAEPGVSRAWAEHFWTVNSGFRRVGEDIVLGEKYLEDPETYYLDLAKSIDNALTLQNPLERSHYIRYEANDPNVIFANTLCLKIISAFRFTHHVVDFSKFMQLLRYEVSVTLGVDARRRAEHEKGSLLHIGFEAGGILRYMKGLLLNQKFLRDNLAYEILPSVKEFEEKNQGKGIATYFSDLLGRIGGEGVTEERSHQVENDKLESGNLPAIFEGTLDRDAMAKALNRVMEQRGLSVRKAAAEAGTGSKDIQRIANGEATIDKSLSVLKSLGCDFFVEITPDEPK